MILYVSYRFASDIGAAIHLDILKELYGPENVYIVDLRMGDASEAENYIAFGKYKNKGARIRQWLQGNIMYIDNAAIDRICEIIKTHDIRQVFLEDSFFGNLAKKMRRQFPDISIVAFYHDIAADLYRQRMRHDSSLTNCIEAIITIWQEKLQQKYTDVNVVFSRREVDLYKKYYGSSPEAVIPLSAYIPSHSNDYMQGKCTVCGTTHLLFVGTRYWPNMVGIRWFCSKVLPKLSDNIVLDIVGRGTELLREELTDPRVVVHGGVEDLHQFYRDADIVIVPLFDGGGMKMKTAEAISFAKCIVGTDEGLTGFWDGMDDTVREKSMFLCNTEKQWYETINRLACEPIPKFSQPLYDLFLQKFSYDATKRELTALFDKR